MPNYRYEGFKEVVMTSSKNKLSGEGHRSSANYLFTKEAFKGCNQIRWSCKDGIRFKVMKDHSAGSDDTLIKEVSNGKVTDRIDGEGIYIADPEGADADFEIRVTVEN